VETPSFSTAVLKLERPLELSSFHTTALCSILAIDDGVSLAGSGMVTFFAPLLLAFSLF
jgi:hypothetical protein